MEKFSFSLASASIPTIILDRNCILVPKLIFWNCLPFCHSLFICLVIFKSFIVKFHWQSLMSEVSKEYSQLEYHIKTFLHIYGWENGYLISSCFKRWLRNIGDSSSIYFMPIWFVINNLYLYSFSFAVKELSFFSFSYLNLCNVKGSLHTHFLHILCEWLF